MAVIFAILTAFLTGAATVLYIQHAMTERRGRQIDELVRRVADENPETGLGL